MTPGTGPSTTEGPVPSSGGDSPVGAHPVAPPVGDGDPGALHHLDTAAIRALAPEVLVSDLDGVIRVFDSALWTDLGERLGLSARAVYGAVLRSPVLSEVTRGRATHAQWRAHAVRTLVDAGAAPTVAREAVDTWAATPARVDRTVVGALRTAREHGIPVFVFTNGTDRVRAELTELGLDDLLGPGGTHLLNSAELGAAKPDPEAFAAAHARIEQVLGHPVRRGAVAFFDDSRSHVEGARRFGWTAVLHRS